MSTERSRELYALADAVLLPGFDGPVAPDWLLRRLGDGLGGVVLYHGNMAGPEALAALTASLRSENPDVLIGVDEEGGDVTRLHLDEGGPWPGNLALGRVDDLELTRSVAAGIGTALAAHGVNLDFAPVVDVNTESRNPVIGTRSFGADPARVAAHSAAYIEGLQSTGVAGCAKHFPGHGSTTEDSHHDLPVVTDPRDVFEAAAFPPFRAAVAADVAAVMTAHILLPAYDEVPATVSRTLLTDVLRGELGYQGAVITDSMEMQAVHDRYGIAGTGLRAIAAGADALCVGTRYGEARDRLLRDTLVRAVVAGELPAERLAEAAGRMARLAGRARLGPGPYTPAPTAPAVAAARRALLVRDVRPLVSAPLVLEFHAEPTPAIGETGWGITGLLRQAFPDLTVVRISSAADDLPDLTIRRPIVAVVRDVHRHPVHAAVLGRLLAARPDSTVVELGLPHLQPPAPTPYLAAFGASRASAIAAARILTRQFDSSPGSTDR